jgi:hypothetical protein
MNSSFKRIITGVAALAVLASTSLASAVTQPDGTVIPKLADTNGAAEGLGTECWGNVENCMNRYEAGLPLSGALATLPKIIDAIKDASTEPKTFVPACSLTFTVLARGGIKAKSFGWYNKTTGRPPASDLHIFINSKEIGSAKPFSKELNITADPTYQGGEIGFFFVSSDGTFYSESQYNQDCADQIHHLIWKSVKDPKAWYFGWEDLKCGGDNDFEDLLMQVSGIYCSGGGASCVVPTFPATTHCSEGHVQCQGGNLACIPDRPPAAKDMCNSLDDDCDEVVDEDGCPNPEEICDRGVCVALCSGGEFRCLDPEKPTCNSKGLCVEAACADVECPAGKVCKGGVCTDGCAGVTCPFGQNCWAGRCVDPCAGITCDTGAVCQDGICRNCACEGCPVGLSCVDKYCIDQQCVCVT